MGTVQHTGMWGWSVRWVQYSIQVWSGGYSTAHRYGLLGGYSTAHRYGLLGGYSTAHRYVGLVC